MADLFERLSTAVAGRYRIARELGRGGMATVYLADDLKHRRRVAVKVLDPEVAAAIGPERFLREIEIASRLTHPHIVPLFDSGAAGSLLWYVMPYIEGESLRQRLQREKQLPLEEALRLAREIGSALGYAHGQGLVHRDVKPENILLADGIALVADFGIARAARGAAGPALTQTGVTVGTPQYMSPEQASGTGDLDGRSDLYSLACVLYEMLAGQPPFAGPTAASLLHQHLAVVPRPVTDLRPDVPGGVALVLARALTKAPAERYPTVARMVEALLAVLAGAPTPPALPRHEAIPGNLPRQRTSFVGREREVAECTRLLEETRLLTLTGVGGCGKTRLALRLAEILLQDFPDGVWLADLAPVSEKARVVLTLAMAMGVQEDPGKPLLETVTRRLANRRALILLDNCEHLVSECAAVAAGLLAGSPELRVVATSREALGIEEEYPFGLDPLDIPAAGAERDLRALEASAAVRLFVSRARLVTPDFALDEEVAPAVAEICRRLDGIPLAIELAAARVQVLAPEQIRARLDDRFRLLAGRGRPLARHQTLRAAMEWSYELLKPEERRALRIFSVFAGGWSLAGAAAVAGEAADEFEVLEWLSRLVDKSLVVVGRAEAGEARYRMLETVRQYGRERLDESREGDDVRTRHLGYYLSIAEEAGPHLRRPEAAGWLRRLDREVENLLAAHSWCDSAPDGGDKGLRLVGALWGYWRNRGLFSLGLEMGRGALARESARTGTHTRVQALYGVGALAYWQGQYGEARVCFEEGLAISEGIGDARGVALGNSRLGHVASAQADLTAARQHHEQAVKVAREIDEAPSLAAALTGLGEILRMQGDLSQAASHYEEALAVSRAMEDTAHVAAGLYNVAMVLICQGALDAARDRLAEAVQIIEAARPLEQGAVALEVGTGLAAARGDWGQAAKLLGASRRLREQSGLRRDPADERFLAPFVDRARRELGEAGFQVEADAGRALSHERALAELRAWLEKTGEAGAGG